MKWDLTINEQFHLLVPHENNFVLKLIIKKLWACIIYFICDCVRMYNISSCKDFARVLGLPSERTCRWGIAFRCSFWIYNFQVRYMHISRGRKMTAVTMMELSNLNNVWKLIESPKPCIRSEIILPFFPVWLFEFVFVKFVHFSSQ